MTSLVSILQVPAVAGLVKSLTGKLFGRRAAVKMKVTAFALPAGVVEIAMLVMQLLDPGLHVIVQPHLASILEVAALVGLIIAYYTPEEEV